MDPTQVNWYSDNNCTVGIQTANIQIIEKFLITNLKLLGIQVVACETNYKFAIWNPAVVVEMAG